MPAFLAVGRILGPHGVRGEVKVEVLTDFNSRFDPGSKLWIEGEAAPCEVQASRPHKEKLLVRLDCVPDRTQAERLRGRHLLAPRAEATPLPEGEYYSDELEGLTVVSSEGRTLGTLTDVLWTGANEVYVVEGDLGEVLLPAIADVVQEVDLQKQKMVVKLLPGLVPALETNSGKHPEH